MKITKGLTIKIFEEIFGDYLIAEWFERTTLEKQRVINDITEYL